MKSTMTFFVALLLAALSASALAMPCGQGRQREVVPANTPSVRLHLAFAETSSLPPAI